MHLGNTSGTEMNHGLALICAVLLLSSPVLGLAADGTAVDYNRDIRPILADNCYTCHGPDAKQRKARLRLDTEEGALAELRHGRAIVPGKSAESRLIARITAADPEDRMPPATSGKKLAPEQIELLRRWIDEGAVWQGHWAFVPPVRPELPAVRHEGFVRNPIDRFILARLEQEGLRPSPPADRSILIRRLTFDLTGLPPSPAEVDAFLADLAPGAYERLVKRLLDSPRYGEHMARYWLDVARYGDTHGLHLDNERALWKYREWVIDAFNRNEPFDRFTVEQLAGDLLPEPTLEQRIATGFNRCNVTTGEGGSIDDEVRVRYAVDRTEVMATVFLGLTAGCAACHDHKFDPISQKEFYQLYAFFNNAADAPMDGNALAPPPIVRVPAPEQSAELAHLDERIAAVRAQIAEELGKVEYAEPTELTGGVVIEPGDVVIEPTDYVWIDDAPPPGAKPQGDTPWELVGRPEHPVLSGEKSMRRSARGQSQHFFEGATPGLKIGEGDRLFAHVYLVADDLPATIMLQFNDGSWEHRAFWGEDSIPFGQSGTPSRLHLGPLPPPGEWVRLEVDAAKVGLVPGAVLNGWAFTQKGGTVYWDRAGSFTRTPQDGSSFESLARWEAYEKAQSKSSLPKPVLEAIRLEPDKRTSKQRKLILDHFVEHVYEKTRPIFEPLQRERDELVKRRGEVDAAIPVSMVMADQPAPRESFLLIRGQYDRPGEKVTPGVPEALPPLPEDAPPNRLGLARWLVDPGHPLTARVSVNRFWQQYFGRGLVKTTEDFGSQGEWPSHPELLDWLAVELIESGWDVKHLQRLIVDSAAYRQSSAVTPELLERDPENVLLARGPRFRLDAEMVRDASLFISGQLVEQIGGKSVKPYQPAGIWEAIGFVGSNTREYKRDAGEALYRRSMYTFWKRTAPPPSLMAFDAPSRETCTARRARTNTPLQALILMNDEQYVEASRHLALRMMEGGATARERLAHGFRLTTARRPDPGELEVLEGILERHLAHYRANEEAAGKLLEVGESKLPDGERDAAEVAAFTLMANLLLNLDETITKE
jgi:mono/diheme cytochrome c family protein